MISKVHTNEHMILGSKNFQFYFVTYSLFLHNTTNNSQVQKKYYKTQSTKDKKTNALMTTELCVQMISVFNIYKIIIYCN